MKEQKHNRARDILSRYVKGQCTDEEKVWVEQWYKENYDPEFEIDQASVDEHFSEVWSILEAGMESKKRRISRKAIAVAASIVFLMGISVFFLWKSEPERVEQEMGQEEPYEIKPGRNQAVLTLADGRTVHLDSLVIGDRMDENGILIAKSDDGTLEYRMDRGDGFPGTDKYNTITTPRGGQYKVILPDHSVVWLNAASSLRFPIAFSDNMRIVELEGEGYFEVAHDSKKPFIVQSNNQQTLVKGTKFNIAAYPEDQITTTTLLEGSVLVQASSGSSTHPEEILLRPNDQVVNRGNALTKTKVEATEAIAWKGGKFAFNNTPLPEIMKQLERWYDVQVDYMDQVHDITFTGQISRFDDIHDLLRKISLTESVRFDIEERRIMVHR